MTDKARIALAEAMGISILHETGWDITDIKFDPFTDANDDYAVLEWMRAREDTLDDCRYWDLMEDSLRSAAVEVPTDYKIGDYARAACRVLSIDQ